VIGIRNRWVSFKFHCHDFKHSCTDPSRIRERGKSEVFLLHIFECNFFGIRGI
jgi:hypothetical protein